MMEKVIFGDFEERYTDYKAAEIAVLPVPYDGTSTWVKGADRGPRALLEASFNMEFYDLETGTEVFRRGIATVDAVTEKGSPEAMAEEVERRMDALLADGKFPVLVGGEHSVSVGAFRAMAKRYGEFSILQLDAHSDMRDEYEGSRYNHACVMARGKEVTGSFAQVGIRSSAAEERGNIDPQRIFYAHDIKESGGTTWMYEVSQVLGDNVYVTVDLDVLDPAYMPSTGTPEPDGLTYREVLNLLKLINERHNVVGLDVVELCPNEGNKAPDFLAAKLVYQFLSLRFK